MTSVFYIFNFFKIVCIIIYAILPTLIVKLDCMRVLFPGFRQNPRLLLPAFLQSHARCRRNFPWNISALFRQRYQKAFLKLDVTSSPVISIKLWFSSKISLPASLLLTENKFNNLNHNELSFSSITFSSSRINGKEILKTDPWPRTLSTVIFPW